MSKAGCQAGAVIVANLLTKKRKSQSSREAARSHRLRRRAVGVA